MIEEFHGEEMFLPNYVDDLHSTSTIPYMMGLNSGDGMIYLMEGI